MPGIRRIWTGPHGTAPSKRALEDATSDPLGLWIAPTPPARDQVVRAWGYGLRLPAISGPGAGRTSGPRSGTPRPGGRRGSRTRPRTALGEAIARAPADGALREVAEVVDRPGFRRRLRARIAAWTRAERPIEATAARPRARPAGSGRSSSATAAILQRLDAVDAEGLAVWASKALVTTPPATFRKLGAVTFLEPSLESPAAWRVLEHAHRRARSVRVALAHDPDPALAEAFAEAAAIPVSACSPGASTRPGSDDLFRPAGLRDVERELFRVDSHRRERLKAANGLAVRGAPEGEGVGLVIAAGGQKAPGSGDRPRGDPGPLPPLGRSRRAGAGDAPGVGTPGRRRGAAPASPAPRRAPAGDELAGRGMGGRAPDPVAPQRPTPPRLAGERGAGRPADRRLGAPIHPRLPRPGSDRDGARSRHRRASQGAAQGRSGSASPGQWLTDSDGRSNRSISPGPGATRRSDSGRWRKTSGSAGRAITPSTTCGWPSRTTVPCWSGWAEATSPGRGPTSPARSIGWSATSPRAPHLPWCHGPARPGRFRRGGPRHACLPGQPRRGDVPDP